jgi:hypothetical protein
MKITTMIAATLAATIITMMCGCSSEESLNGSFDAPRLTLSVCDQGFASADGTKTRTTDNGTATSFSANDAIGIYITDGTNVKFANLKYTFDGTNWTSSVYGTALPYIANGKYFAYYPYQEAYNASNVTAAATTTDDFFATMISGWTPATDQSTHDKYTAQDLMTAIGASTDGYQFTFDMTHQMALAEMDFPQITYWLSTGVYTGTTSNKYRFKDYTPYNIGDGQYRLIINPITTTSISGTIYGDPTTLLGSWSIDSPAKSYIKTFKADSESPFLISCVPAVGSIYYSDGTCANKLIEGKTPIGVVVSTNSTYCEPDQANNQFGHGLVMALKYVESTIAMWQTEDVTDAGLTKCTTYKDLYNDKSGLTNQNKVGISDTYPAFKAAYNYLSAVHPTTSSSWFLPSAGQWWDAMEQATTKYGKTLKIADYHDNSSDYEDNWISGDVIAALNKLMKNYSGLDFWELDSRIFWTGSEKDESYACIVQLNIYQGLEFGSYYKANEGYVRPFLAF